MDCSGSRNLRRLKRLYRMETLLTSRGAERLRATRLPGDDGCSYAFWLLVGMVLLLAAVNLLITLTLISVLRISMGMECIQVVQDNTVLSGSVDLDRLYKPDGSILGFAFEGMSILGDGGAVDILVSGDGSQVGPRMSLSHEGVQVSGVRGADVSDGTRPVFATGFPNFGLPAGVRGLRVREARTRRVVGPGDRPLRLLSGTQLHLRGSEGTHVRGRRLVLSADQELYLKSVNGSVELRGADGVRLDVRSLPWTEGRPQRRRGSVGAPDAYLLCACAADGQLFRVPVPQHVVDDGNSRQPPVSCSSVRASSPCI